MEASIADPARLSWDWVETVANLAPLVDEWEDLAGASAFPNIFLTPDWVACYLKHLGRRDRPHFLTVRHGTRLVGLLPLSEPLEPLRCWRLTGTGVYDYSGLLARSGYEKAVAATVVTALADRREEWDLLDFQQFSTEDPLSLLQFPPPFRSHRSDGETCPTLDLPHSYDALLSSLSRNMRGNLRRYPRRLADRWAVETRLASAEDECRRTLQQLFWLHAVRWRERGLPGVLSLPSRQRFHTDLCVQLLRRDRLRLLSLALEDQVVAILLNYAFGGRYFFFIGGFDPGVAEHSPGIVLFASAFQHAIRERAYEFDFLRGEETYKYRFGARDRHYVNLRIAKPSARSHLAHVRSNMETHIAEYAREWARRRYGGN